METVKVILMGLGVVGKNIAKILVQKKGIEIVGALDTDKKLAGKDLGEVAGLGRKLNITVTEDADSIFSESCADVLIHTVCIYLYQLYPQIKRAIEEEINIISSAEELSNPYVSNPVLASKLDKLARLNGVTVLGSGILPGYMDYLVLSLTGACRNVRKISTLRYVDISPYTGQKHFGVGLTPEEFKRRAKEGSVTGHMGYVQQIRLISDRIGLKIDDVSTKVEPVMDERGLVNGCRNIGEGIKAGEVKIHMQLEACADPKRKTEDHITIEAEPDISMDIRPPGILSLETTSNTIVNAIPHVINAKPGIMTTVDLPLLFALDDDVRLYIE
ncbi:NADP-binding protein [Chloroflexota bacterium]